MENNSQALLGEKKLVICSIEERAMCQSEALPESTGKWYVVITVQLFYGLKLKNELMFLWYFLDIVCPNIIIRYFETGWYNVQSLWSTFFMS